jgi:opacity protein-like surface antigen
LEKRTVDLFKAQKASGFPLKKKFSVWHKSCSIFSGRRNRMKRKLILLTALFLLVPGLVFSDVVSFKVGYFIPRAQSDLWEIELEQMTFNKSNFQNTNFCFAYEYFLTRQISVVIGIDSYSKNKGGEYLDYVGEEIGGDFYAFDYGEGFSIYHIFSVSITPIQLSLKLTPMGRQDKIIPYVGGGVGLYVWTVRLQGEMVDFSEEIPFIDAETGEDLPPGYIVFPIDARAENRIAFGYHVFGGIMIPFARRMTLDVQFKYNAAKGNFSDDPGSGFEGFEAFDLGGYQISAGINYWF